MLGPAFKTLSDPCIGTLWSVTYDSFAGVFAILAILIMQLLQLTMTAFFSGQQKKTSCEEISAHNIEDSKKTDGHHHHHHHHHHPGSLPKDVRLNKRIALSLLEVGIALHSIVIGIALGISTGSEFTALFVALCFHQFFEGLALGSTISAAEFSKVKSMLLACVYGVTTPLGIGIGMAVRTFYSPDSPDGLLVTGIMDSMSGGVLIYTALVEFLDIKTIVNEEFNEFGFASKFLSVAACWLGCAVMAVLGLWA